jgi:hypothetical protein
MLLATMLYVAMEVASAGNLLQPEDAATAPVVVAEVNEARGGGSGRVSVTIRNSSRKSVRWLAVSFGAPPCRRERRKPIWPVLTHGRRAAADAETSVRVVAPGETATLSVPPRQVDQMRRYMTRMACGPADHFSVAVTHVVFQDGAEWTVGP